ncbi:MAG: AmmeMemoRadiSam system protein B [Candidatus Brocadiales bacterium]|nr:AmmeMemoRadiSam system protein B [Candidatus Bathyanammoxibius amoris]
MEYPKLRPVEAFPYNEPGKEGICLRDPSNITDTILVVPHHLFEIIRLFDGRHSLLDVQTVYAKRHGNIPLKEQIEGVINTLDKAMLLESERFTQFLKDLKEEFRRSSIRKAAFAGKGYDSDPGKLRQQIDTFFTSDGGPCKPGGKRSGKKSKNVVKGAVLPHIDFDRGGPCFAWGYKEIEKSSNARCFILLGTSHGDMNGLFSVTKKDFETPFGLLRTDKEIVTAIEKAGGKGFFKGEFAHKNEHSLEFQAIFLHYLYDGKRDVSIVPVLCSSFHEMIKDGKSPSSVQEVNDFIETLKGVIKGNGKDVFLIASADLSHVGPRFGDPLPLTSQDLQKIAEEDMDMIRFIENVDAEGFFHSIQKDGDRRKICGLSPIYVLLKVLDASRGKLLKYEQWPDPRGMVSFASIGLY